MTAGFGKKCDTEFDNIASLLLCDNKCIIIVEYLLLNENLFHEETHFN